MKDIGIFYGHWVNFTASWLFGIFFPFGYVVARKIWQPCFDKKNTYATDSRLNLPGADPAVVSYNAANSLLRFEMKKYFLPR
jgi:hypothetical protein